MPPPRRFIPVPLALAALLALSPASLPARGDEPGTLFVRRAKLVPETDSLTLTGTFAARDVPRFFISEDDLFELRIGGAAIVTLGLEDGTRWKPRRGLGGGSASRRGRRDRPAPPGSTWTTTRGGSG